jgi:molecular chaperone GrpE (heat shock protein)
VGWRNIFNYWGNIFLFVMVNFLYEYWQTILATLSAPVMWFFGGRAKQSQDAVSTMKTMYDDFLTVYKNRMDEVMQEVTDIKKHNLTLQTDFNNIQMSYAKEVEKSQNWEKLHRQLTDKYNELAKDYESLKGLYSKLKTDFDNHKKLKQ